jgi:hypothetical protein
VNDTKGAGTSVSYMLKVIVVNKERLKREEI